MHYRKIAHLLSWAVSVVPCSARATLFSSDDEQLPSFFAFFSFILTLIRLPFFPIASSLFSLPEYKFRSNLPRCFLAVLTQTQAKLILPRFFSNSSPYFCRFLLSFSRTQPFLSIPQNKTQTNPKLCWILDLYIHGPIYRKFRLIACRHVSCHYKASSWLPSGLIVFSTCPKIILDNIWNLKLNLNVIWNLNLVLVRFENHNI